MGVPILWSCLGAKEPRLHCGLEIPAPYPRLRLRIRINKSTQPTDSDSENISAGIVIVVLAHRPHGFGDFGNGLENQGIRGAGMH